MKRITLIFISLLTSVVLFAQTATTPANYKEGDFTTKTVKAKTVNVDGSWTIAKNKTSKAFELKYGNTTVATLTTAGAITLTATVTTTQVTATTAVKAPYIWSTNKDGALFTDADGNTRKLQLTSGGTATYVTVTTPSY